MNEFLQTINDKFWSKDIWLVGNYTWDDLTPGLRDGVQYREHNDLFYYGFPMAIIILGLRFYLEKYWFAPLGISLGIKHTRTKRAESNPVLEKVYSQKITKDHRQIQGLVKKLGWSESRVRRWLRLRKSQDKSTPLVKFCECLWRLTYYFCSFTFGVFILWDKPWMWNFDEFWVGYPQHGMPNSIWWQYVISVALYISMSISQFSDVQRKDFWENVIHHIVTIFLLWFSWVTNFYRIGSVILVLHDSADVFMELAKFLKYVGHDRYAVFVFAVFTKVWFITRLGIFPFYIIESVVIRFPKMFPMFPGFYIFMGMLISLFLLHLMWTYFILKIMYQTLVTGTGRDSRSSSSSCSEDSERE